MRPIFISVLVGSLVITPSKGLAQESVARSKIVSVSVFKNGLALVQLEVQVPEAGGYRLDSAPEPIHGTFWIKSNCQVETALRQLEVETPQARGGLQEELAGKEVVIHLKDSRGNQAGVAGTVEQTPRNASGFLVLKTAKGSSYVNPSEIAYVEVKGGAPRKKENTVKQQRPVLVLTVAKTEKKPEITVSYLTRGLSWAPSYLVEIIDGKELTIESAVAVRNELATLQDAEIKLLSGLPTIQFAHVVSPLGPRQNLEKFLAGLRSEGAQLGDGMEMHPTSIGKRSLKEGESLSLSLGRAKVGYERVVEWDVSSDERGAVAEETWDVLHFKNPFSFPMATAPALVMDREQFASQRTCSQALAGEGSSLRFARSLDMRTRGQDREDPPKEVDKNGKPAVVRIGVNEYRRATIQGEMTVTNQRPQSSKIIVRRTLKGRVLDSDGKPKVQPQEEGLRAVNPSYEITWTLNLAAGEEKTVHYSYQILIPLGNDRLQFTW